MQRVFKHLYLLIAIKRTLPGLGPDTVRILFHLTVGAIDGLLTLDPDLCVLNQSSLYTILSVNNSDSSILTRIIAPSRKMRYFCLCFRLTFISLTMIHQRVLSHMMRSSHVIYTDSARRSKFHCCNHI